MRNINKILQIGSVFFFLYLYLSLEPMAVLADSYYPLQTKFPDTIIYKVETNEKIIALTFDDGPDNVYTPKVLDVLKKHGVQATFFLLGARVEKYPEVVKRIDEEQHEIGNHTFWHPELTKTGVENMKFEIEKSDKAITSVLREKPELFRAPYGSLTEEMVQTLPDLGYKAVGWSIDSEDWKGLSKEEIKQQVINSLHPGSIVLMHSVGDVEGTVEAVDELIPYLKSLGYHFVTVPEMWQTEYK